MVEYTVETLVHLYDNLNNQIENIRNNLNDFNSIRIDQNTKPEFETELETAYTKAEKRLEKLINMRDDVEELLDRILEAEISNRRIY